VERRAWLERSVRAAGMLADPALELACAQALALELESTGEARAALGVLEAVAARRPAAGAAGLYVDAQRVELARACGEPARAVALAAELLARPPAAEETELRRQIARSRDYAWLDLGLPDLAWPGVMQRARAQEGDDAELVETRLQELHLLLAVGDERVPEEVERSSGMVRLSALDAGRFELLAAASELGARTPEALARARVRLARLPELAGPEALYAALLRADAALQAGELGTAADELAQARSVRGPAGGPEARTLALLAAEHALSSGAPRAELEQCHVALERAQEEELAEWRALPQRMGGFGYLLYGRRRELIGSTAALALALHGEERAAREALAHVLALQELGTLARASGARAPSLARLRATVVGADTGLLVYLPANPRSLVLWVDAHGLGLLELVAGDELERRRGAYLAHLLAGSEVPPSERAALRARERELAAALSEALLPPTLHPQLARWQRLAFANLDLFGPVPFPWLPLGEVVHLGAAKELVSVPSLPLAAARPPGARATERDFLLVGGARSGTRADGLAEVPLSDELADELCAPFARSHVLAGAEATRARLAAAGLDGTRVLQFLGHGVEEPGREHALALLFTPDGDDGLLRAEDVRTTGAPALVLLTGCRTGAAPLRKGDALAAGMAGAWLVAGADVVLVAENELELGEVRRFSRAFGTELARGAAPSAALRAAVADAARRHGADAPFAAGLFELLGSGHAPLFDSSARETRAPFFAGTLGAVLGALLVLFFARVRRGRAERGSSGSGAS